MREEGYMKKFALIQMPWGMIRYPSSAVGLLKAVLAREDLKTDAFYLNIRFAKYLYYNNLYMSFENDVFLGNWFFSHYLFGNYGTGELDTSYEHILKSLGSNPPNLARAAIISKNKALIEHIVNRVIPQYLKECLESISWEDYYAVGFSCQFFNQYIPSLVLSNRLKQKYPHLKIIFGGAAVFGTNGFGTLKSFKWIDYVIDGEGELSLPQLLRGIQAGDVYKNIPGVSFNKGADTVIHNGRPEFTQLDKNPVPEYSDYYKELKKANIDQTLGEKILFEGSRGCWWGQKVQCTFCSENAHSLEYRSKSPERIYSEIVELLNQYPQANKLFATDNILNSDFFDTLLPRLKEIRRISSIMFEVKSNLDRRQLILLKDAHIKIIQPGIESLNTDMLRLMRKGVSAIRNIQTLKISSELSFKVIWNLLHSVPGEKKEHYAKLVNTISIVSHLQPPSVCIPILLEKYSAYFKDPVKYNIRDIRPASFYSLLFPEGRVCLEDIAYYYDYTHDSYSDIDIRMLKDQIIKMCQAWSNYYKEEKIYCNFIEFGDSIKITDNRPEYLENISEPLKDKQYEYNGVRKTVYCLCSDIHSFNELLNCTSIYCNSISEHELREVLDEFISKRLMYFEGGQYLSLALRKT
jgi:bacteriocin maturation radical SAM protein 1